MTDGWPTPHFIAGFGKRTAIVEGRVVLALAMLRRVYWQTQGGDQMYICLDEDHSAIRLGKRRNVNVAGWQAIEGLI